MNSNFKDKTMEEIYNTLLEILDEHEVSPEDGAVLSANLLFNSLSFLNDDGSNELSESLSEIENILSGNLSETLKNIPHSPMLSIFRPRNESFSVIGLDRIWGLDPALVDEEH
jgi:hypothetical protein